MLPVLTTVTTAAWADAGTIKVLAGRLMVGWPFRLMGKGAGRVAGWNDVLAMDIRGVNAQVPEASGDTVHLRLSGVDEAFSASGCMRIAENVEGEDESGCHPTPAMLVTVRPVGRSQSIRTGLFSGVLPVLVMDSCATDALPASREGADTSTRSEGMVVVSNATVVSALQMFPDCDRKRSVCFPSGIRRRDVYPASRSHRKEMSELSTAT